MFIDLVVLDPSNPWYILKSIFLMLAIELQFAYSALGAAKRCRLRTRSGDSIWGDPHHDASCLPTLTCLNCFGKYVGMWNMDGHNIYIMLLCVGLDGAWSCSAAPGLRRSTTPRTSLIRLGSLVCPRPLSSPRPLPSHRLRPRPKASLRRQRKPPRIEFLYNCLLW